MFESNTEILLHFNTTLAHGFKGCYWIFECRYYVMQLLITLKLDYNLLGMFCIKVVKNRKLSFYPIAMYFRVKQPLKQERVAGTSGNGFT